MARDTYYNPETYTQQLQKRGWVKTKLGFCHSKFIEQFFSLWEALRLEGIG